MKIKINATSYSVKFGYGSYRRICEFYGLTKVSGFNDLVKRFKLEKMQDPQFDQMGFIGNLVVAGIQNANPEEELVITSDDVVDVLWQDAKLLTQVMEEFSKSIPKETPEPKGK